MRGARILVVDDEEAIVKMARNLLRAAGEAYVVEGVGDPAAAIEKIRVWQPDLVLLDLQFGHRLTGLEVCQAIRENPDLANVAIVVLTGIEADEVEATLLEAGADDYIRKGQFNPRLLLSRIRAVLRRTRGGVQAVVKPSTASPPSALPEHVIEHGPLKMDPISGEADVGGRSLELTPTEFRLLYRLASNPDRALKRAELAGRRAGAPQPGRAVDVHVLSLRRKLADHGWLVQTVLRHGYRLGNEPDTTLK